MKWSWTKHINRFKDDRYGPRVSPLGDHMTRKPREDKTGDQPSDEETRRPGKIPEAHRHHKTCEIVGGMQTHSHNYGQTTAVQ